MVAKYFHKGQEIIVEGKLSTREWTDRNGNKRSTNEMTVDRVHFCGPKQSEGGNVPESELPPYRAAGSGVNVSAGDFADLEDDGELPF
ncbi:Single-stranded DNA-binding protein [Intestinimonas butyriciproducens]|nr:Single-stranded DNA-binding protein [Intestinimonas butyriciproducens]